MDWEESGAQTCVLWHLSQVNERDFRIDFPPNYLLTQILKNIIYFLAVLGLRCCTWAFSSRLELGLLSGCGVQASHCGGFSSCGV